MLKLRLGAGDAPLDAAWILSRRYVLQRELDLVAVAVLHRSGKALVIVEERDPVRAR
jgi:hypothetical protein